MKKKIAFIVQRYGIEVNGGAEYHCRIIAERLNDMYNVEVLTSCAKDYMTWANEYPPGTSKVNGVKVHRFEVAHPREWHRFRSINRKIKKRKPYQKALKFLGLLGWYEKMLPAADIVRDEDKWIEEQGPYLPGLVNYIAANQQRYDVLVFFTYLYYPTIEGIKIAPQKSILIPTAHDEPPIYFNIFKKFFKTPAAILYNTASEKEFVNRLFNNEDIYSDIVGVGIESPAPVTKPDVRQILNTISPYIVYIGRIDASKGCKHLAEYFLQYKQRTGSDIKLVFVGQAFMKLPQHPDIIAVGFVDEDIKIALLKNAEALVMPSFYESLSMVTLEGMAYGIPVIANAKCEVLKDHIDKSEAGFLYTDQQSFRVALNNILAPDINRAALSANAKKYVAQNYTWPAVLQKFDKAIAHITGG